MPHAPGHLRDHPLPPGIVGALGISGYQLLADVAGVGAGRIGSQIFLLVAPDPDPSRGEGGVDMGTQIALHQPRLKNEADVAAFTQLAGSEGFDSESASRRNRPPPVPRTRTWARASGSPARVNDSTSSGRFVTEPSISST